MPVSTNVPTLTLPAGMRATRAVQALLSVLPAQPEGGWTEALVEAALTGQGITVNRVTVYRALDRLTAAGLLLRTVDSQRITRYWVSEKTARTPSAHMECEACHQPMPLDANAAAVQAALLALQQAVAQSAGVPRARLNVTVQAQCTQCEEEMAQHSSSNS